MEKPMGWILFLSTVLQVLCLSTPIAHADRGNDFHAWASTPPMGWNSWDCFGTTITEKQAREQADAMATYLKPAGYTIFTVDIQWYEPGSQGHSYKEGAPLAMDEFCRLLPAVEKFPSAANGAGFTPLADYVHSKGLKFGIHIMRGIPRQAVRKNTAIKGTTYRAADIADTSSICPWNPDMYGVDMNKPGAQEYYDSLYGLFASWGVDFVKVDDISRPYDPVQKAEIEAIRKAIDKCGRPMILSLSPGDTPIERGEHVMNHANMWRISDDFWDRWQPLYGMFGRLEKWTKYRTRGAWPDADMLPFGIIEFNRPTKFTQDEQILCMSLWCIARSPLILGADMTKLDDFTRNLLTNPEVLAISQKSIGNRQLSRKDDLIVWTADIPDSPDRYVALFNAQSNDDPFDLSKADYRGRTIRGVPGQEVVDISVPIKNARRLVLAVEDGGDGNFYDHAGWIEPRVTGPKGTLKLTDLDWVMARAGWSEVQKNRTVDGRPLTLNGKPVEGIGTHSVSVIEFELPEGYDTFLAQGVITEGSGGKGSLEFLVLVNPDKQVLPEHSRVSVAFSDLGITGKAQVRDLWKKQDMGVFSDAFSQELPLHGAGLYRVTPQPHMAGENPIFRDAFTADPAPLVVGDTLYLYVGHDEAREGQMFNITEWLCYSTQNMKEWTAHGSVLKPTDFKWAVADAWASQVVEKEGRFYYYTTVQHGAPYNCKAIGVAVADSPTGPFEDALGKALVIDADTPGGGWNDIDPTVLIDDDGTSWMCWGNGTCFFAKLKPNMIEIDGEIQQFKLDRYVEGPWLHKRGDTYYLTYAGFSRGSENIRYATAPKITGPWTSRGELTGMAKNSFTIHPGIVEFKNQWYLFYHNATLTLNGETGAVGRRSVCAEYLFYNPDGTLKPIVQTVEGISISPGKMEVK